MERINLALVGYGKWGRFLYKHFERDALFQVRAVVCRTPKSDISANLFEPDLAKVLRERPIDAVVVATPSETHFQIGCQVLAAGKHLWLEKPPALRSENMRLLAKIAAQKEVKVLVDFTFTFSAALAAMKDLRSQFGLG
ncbi:Gfo/Idh/MocA family oxidoreductase [Candidatus Saganbacteria bacterium]|nr:Gfo/Idh/MocA family oxidoreductase [Candidatus Saganbacteria bacterium]